MKPTNIQNPEYFEEKKDQDLTSPKKKTKKNFKSQASQV